MADRNAGKLMSELKNFPVISQLDGDINQYYDCVATSVAAGLEYLTGRKFTGAELKDAVYGVSYKGNTAAYEYVEYCLKQGVRLFPINGSPAYLVAQAHSELAKGRPVVFTEPDPYMPASSGETHVCVFFKDTASSLTEMDPFGGHVIEKSDAQWISTLEYNQIWSMEKVESTTMGVPSNWKDDGKTLTAPNGVPVILGFRQYVLANNWHPDNYPLQKEHATPQLEASNPALGGGTQQESACASWSGTRKTASSRCGRARRS
jgi:hypothetical protein